MSVARRIVALLLALAAGSTTVAGPAEDAARQFLDAWIYRDAGRVWAMLDDASRQGLTPEALGAALEAQPLLPESAEIDAAEADGTAVRVRFRLHGHHRTSGEPMAQPGTLVVSRPDGQTPRIGLRIAPPPPASTAPASVTVAAQHALPDLPPSQVIDGHTAQDILNAAAARAGEIETLRMNLTVRGAMMGEPVNLAGQFLFQAPNRLRLDLRQALFVFDGMGGICHLPDAHAYFRLPASMSHELIGFAPGLGGAGAGMQASLVAREEIGGVPAWRLALASPPGSTAGSLGPLHLWLSCETLLPVRAETAAMGVVAQLDFRDVVVNGGPLPAEAFAFEPPPDAIEVPMMLPGLPGPGTGG